MVATIAGTSAISPADQFRYVSPAAGLPLGGGGTVGAGAGALASASTGDEDILHALADILRTGTDPEILEAQRILVRRHRARRQCHRLDLSIAV
jgi:hypothetical protein